MKGFSGKSHADRSTFRQGVSGWSGWVWLLPDDDAEGEAAESWVSGNSEEGFQVRMEALPE